jgi:hypothetical protein
MARSSQAKLPEHRKICAIVLLFVAEASQKPFMAFTGNEEPALRACGMRVTRRQRGAKHFGLDVEGNNRRRRGSRWCAPAERLGTAKTDTIRGEVGARIVT